MADTGAARGSGRLWPVDDELTRSIVTGPSFQATSVMRENRVADSSCRLGRRPVQVSLAAGFLSLLLLTALTPPALSQSDLSEEERATTDSEVLEQIDSFLRLSEENQAGNLELAISYAERGLKLAHETHQTSRIAALSMQLGHAWSDQGKQNSALPHYLEALSRYRELGELEATTDALTAVGVAYYYMGFLHLSLEYHLEALSGREQLANLDKAAKSLNNIGLVYFGSGDYADAASFFGRALALKRERSEPESVTKTLSNLGYAHYHLEQYDEALRYQNEALKLSEDIGYDKGIAYALAITGDIERAMGKSRAAFRAYTRSLSLYRESGDLRGVVMVLNNLGAVHRDQGDLEKAAASLLEATETGREIGAKLQLRDAFELLAGVRKDQGNLGEALDVYKRYVAYKDEVLDEESQRQLAEMKVRYESERRAQEIELLKQVNSIKEKEIQRGAQLRAALSVGLILAALTASLLWVLYRQNQKANELLAARNEEAEAARAAALEANQAKSLFLANMSHELRTPMTAIIGYSDLLIEEVGGAASEQTLHDLSNIRNASKHLLALINDVLDLSKIEAGKITLATTTFEISDMINSVVDTIQPLADKNRNRLELVRPKDLGSMLSDETKVRQTLFNLLSNACKFCEGGTVSLEVERLGPPEAERIVFTVRDNGIGMTEDELSRIFHEFEQADASTQRRYGGTGLGLSISRRFARMMGGDLVATSQPEEGSTFILDLPARWHITANKKTVDVSLETTKAAVAS